MMIKDNALKDNALITRIPLEVLASDKGFKRYMRDLVEDSVRKVKGILLDDPTREIVHAFDGMGTGMVPTIIPVDAAFETTPTVTEALVAACPDGLGAQYRLRAVGISAVTIPVDGANVATGDLEFVDDSDSDSVTNLKAAFDFLTITARVYNEIWNGIQDLDPGDTVNMEFTVTTPTTASEGAALYALGNFRQMLAYTG